MCLREDCAWAPEGYEIAFGQGVFRTPDPASEMKAAAGTPEEKTGQSAGESAETAGEKTGEISGSDWKRTIVVRTPCGKLELTRGSFNIGIRGERFDALFSILQGGLVSFRRGGNPFAGGGMTGCAGGPAFGRDAVFTGCELFEKMPRPCFWRAPTSNDIGNHMAARYGAWKLAEEYQIPLPGTLRIFAQEDSVLLQIRHALPIPGVRAQTPEQNPAQNSAQNPMDLLPCVTVGYRFYADGRLTLSMDWDPAMNCAESGPGLPPMPVFGFSFRLNPDLDRFTFYGKGPAENYIDRNRGARLGIFSSSVAQNMSPYLVPQECGNRTGVRWAAVTDRRGRGLQFTADGGKGNDRQPYCAGNSESCQSTCAGMEFSALPYTPQELEAASHPYELPPVHYTNVRCALMQMGVGGDDSWGAPTLPQYCLPADRKLHFEVTAEGI